MKNDGSENAFLKIVSSAWKLEWGSTPGKYNVFFTTLIIFLVIAYQAGDIVKIGIYAFAFREKYETLSFGATVALPLIWGGLCFIFMIIICYKRQEFKMDFNTKSSAKTEVASTLQDNDLHK